MKKAKIMITAIVMFAVVGGALAFKAQNFGASIYTPDPNHTANCNQLTSTYITTAAGTPGSFTVKAAQSSGTSNCVTLTVVNE